jgi:hypothetical protein
VDLDVPAGDVHVVDQQPQQVFSLCVVQLVDDARPPPSTVSGRRSTVSPGPGTSTCRARPRYACLSGEGT